MTATMHRLHAARETPVAQPGKHCQNCSLVETCLPKATSNVEIGTRWRAAQMRSLQQDF